MRYYSSNVMQNILNNERFVNYVDVTLIDGTVINLEPSDLLEGCSISDRIDCLINLIGNTIGKSCTILISNHNGSYTDTDFLGASMKVYTATRIVDVVPFLFKSELGEFSITSVNVDDNAITLTGVDNMIKLDVPYVPTVTLPCTIVDIYEDICAQCGFMSISLGSVGELEISNIPSNCTCRSMIIWICEVLGANAKVSEGYLNISQFFSLPTGVDVKPYSATIAHTSTIVSGIEITNTSGIITTYGSEGFLVRIKNNPLVNEHEQEVGQFLYSILKDFEFVSFSGEFPPDPRFESLDVINVTDKDGILHQTILTGVTYDVSDKMTLECTVSDEPTNNATYEDVETRASEFEAQSKIEQSSSEILLQVSSTYTPKSNAIQTDTLHYLATSASSGVTTSTAGWTTTPQSVTSVNKYLWIYHTYTYADSTAQNPHTSNTTPVIGGVYGDTGAKGDKGDTGTSLTITATSVTYQAGTSGTTKPTGTWSTSVPSVSAGQYLWTKTVVAYSDGTSTESYSVARQGANGTGVTISSTSVTYQAGTSETTAPTGTWSTTIPSVSAGQYLWTKTVVTYSNNTSTIAYSVARQGVNGTNGSDGTSVTVLSVQYAGSTSNTTAPTNGWQSSIPSVSAGQYLWTKTTYSDNNVAYSVARQGQNGSNGTSITISSTSITYQTSNSGTTAPTGTWSTTIPSVSAGQYLWTKTYVKYSDNTETTSYSVARTGTNGTSATTYSLIVSHAAVGKSADGVYNPTAITLMSKSQTGSAALADYAGRFKIETTTDNSTWTAQYTSSSNESSKSYTVPANIKSIRCSLYLAGGTTTLLDQQTVPIVSDGAKGDTGSQGIQGIQGVQGNPGADAYTVLLTNESHTFAGGTSSAIAGSTTIGVVGYKGATQQNTTVGTISGAPTGMSTSISNNTSKTTSITVSVTTSMTTKNGTLTVPVTVDGKTFNLIFSYALALTGAKGDPGSQGPQGVSVASVETLYYAHTSTTSPTAPNSEITSTSTGTGVWTKAVPTLTATNRYMFRCDQIKYNNGSISWSTVVLDDSLTDLTSRMTTAESKITDSAIINTVASNMKNCGRNLLHGTTGAPRAITYPGSSGYNNVAEYYTSIIPTSNSYVLSFEAKSTVAGDKITNYFYDPGTTTSAVSSQGYVSTATDGATKITLTTSWVRYWIKFTQTAANTRKRVLVGRCMYGDGTGTVYIRKVQLEEGTVPTDWSVAPDEGINLTLDTLSVSSPTSYLCAQIPLTKNLEAGKTYTLQLWDCVLDSGSNGLKAYWGGGNIALTGYINPDVNGYASVVFSVTDANASGNGAYNLWLNMYNFNSGHSGSNCTIGKWKLEEGGAATPWSPAPVQIASMTKVEQLTDKISMIVANDSTSSSVVLTPNALIAIANNIDLSGKVTFNSLAASAFQSLSAYGTCSTAAGTAAKVVNDIPNFSLSTMSRVIVFFVNENTASSPTLNVNGTGAATIYTPTSTGIKAISSSNGNTRYNWPKYSTIEFVKYDRGWLMVNGASEAVMNNIYTSGTTTIDGGKITANSVTAREIDVDDLFAQNVTATGTITGVTIKGASGEFTKKFFTDVVLQDTVGNEINGKMFFDPSSKLFKVLIASPEYGDDPQAPFYGTMEFSTQKMSIGHAHNVSIFSQDGKISLSAPIGGISLSPSVSCNEFHANNQFSVSSGGKFIINNANGSGNSKILTSTSSGMAFKSLYDLAVTEGNGTFTDTTISSGTWKKIGKFTIPKGKYLIITQADISTASGGTYTDGVVGLGINTGTSTKSSYARFDSKVNCNAGSVYLQNVRVVSSSSSTGINVWVHSTMASAISVNAGFMYLGLPG